jgi:hypothetical protein
MRWSHHPALIRSLANVGRRFTGGNEFFAVAVAAFQHAVNARLPPTHAVQDEDKLLGQFASANRYRIEGWRAGRNIACSNPPHANRGADEIPMNADA